MIAPVIEQASQMLLATATRTPGFIVGPIAKVMGLLYNLVFNFIYSFVQSGSLGIAIIIFTLIIKMIIYPLSLKQLKSTRGMQKLQPEIERIKAKYAGRTDNDSQQRMMFEVQEYQKEHGISMFGGCLPMLIQLPILYALFYIFQQPANYVDVIAQTYNSIADAIINIPVELRVEVFKPIALAKEMSMDLAVTGDVLNLVNAIKPSEWPAIISSLGSNATELEAIIANKSSIEMFLGFDLISSPGLKFPGIIIPLLSAFSTYLSSSYMMKKQAAPTGDNDMANNMSKTMNIVMPIMMGVFTVSMPVALGIYWTISNFFQLFQTWATNKYFDAQDRKAKEA